MMSLHYPAARGPEAGTLLLGCVKELERKAVLSYWTGHADVN